jgi:hypothetical protein
MIRTPHSHHSPEFKEQALLKARHRGMRSVISIAGELNMSAGTLRKWLQSASKKTGTTAHPVPAATAALDGPASAWSPAQGSICFPCRKRRFGLQHWRGGRYRSCLIPLGFQATSLPRIVGVSIDGYKRCKAGTPLTWV